MHIIKAIKVTCVHDVLVRASNDELGAEAIGEWCVVARIVWLNIDSPLVMEDKRLILPRNLLMGIEQRPHVVARPLIEIHHRRKGVGL